MRRNSWVRNVLGAAVVAFVLVGCGGGDDEIDVTGGWYTLVVKSLTLSLEQSGDSFSGKAYWSGSYYGPVRNGFVAGNNVAFDIGHPNGSTIKYNGSFSEGGARMTTTVTFSTGYVYQEIFVKTSNKAVAAETHVAAEILENYR